MLRKKITTEAAIAISGFLSLQFHQLYGGSWFATALVTVTQLAYACHVILKSNGNFGHNSKFDSGKLNRLPNHQAGVYHLSERSSIPISSDRLAEVPKVKEEYWKRQVRAARVMTWARRSIF